MDDDVVIFNVDADQGFAVESFILSVTEELKNTGGEVVALVTPLPDGATYTVYQTPKTAVSRTGGPKP